MSNENEDDKQALKFTLEIEGPEKGMWSIVIYDNYSPSIKDVLVMKSDSKDLDIKQIFTKIAQRISGYYWKISDLHTHQVNAKVEYTFKLDLGKIADEFKNDLN